MWWVAAWMGCAEEAAPVVAPESHTWSDEAELVVSGLEDAERLWESGQTGPARTMAERVYTDRFEPRLEPALREIEGPAETAAVEYEFGRLLVALDGKDRKKVTARVDVLERRVRQVGDAASRAFPPPGTAPTPPPPPKDVRPIVPNVPANWEQDEAAETPAGEPGTPPAE